MPDFPYSTDIEVPLLRLDTKNPRVANSPDSQVQALERMADAQGDKLIALIAHIVTHNGFNPAHSFLVIRDDDDQFIVLDGNRRLTALKALEQPELVEGALGPTRTKRLKELKSAYTPINDVPCVVFETREQADPWIELIHEGEQGGAGSVSWSAQQKTRHYERKGTKPYHMQVLDFIMSEGDVGEKATRRFERGTYPVSTLERTLSTPELRYKLGIEFEDSQVTTKFPLKQILPGLTRVVDEIGSGEVKVAKVMTKNDRMNYIESFDGSELPDATLKSDVALPIEEAPEGDDQDGGNKGSDRNHSRRRQKMIPADFKISIDVSRINDIYHELKRQLKLNEVPNAAGVLLRVFLELSLDEYIERNSVKIKFRNKNLENKLKAVADYMEDKHILTEKQLIPVRDAVEGKIITTLNQLVHNRDMVLSSSDLKALWDRLQVFFGKLWA